MTREELIARLEKAPKGSDEMDAHILAYFVGDGALVAQSRFNGAWCVYKGTNRAGEPRLWEPDYRDKVRTKLPWSQSLDAALTLVPEHHSYELTQSAVEPPRFARARLWDWRRSPTGFDPGNEWKSEGNRPLTIAVCSAALKAGA